MVEDRPVQATESLEAFCSLTWRSAPGDALSRARWPGEPDSLCFDARSGHTHVLTPLATAILDALAAGPMRGEALLRALALNAEPAGSNPLVGEAADALARMEAVGLVQREH